MRNFWLPLLFVFTLGTLGVQPAHAYIEVPYALGKCVSESSNIVVMELVRIITRNKAKRARLSGDC